jgi:hypothetical protein
LIKCRSDMLFLHTSALRRHACGEISECDDELDTILADAARGRRRMWMSSLFFAELTPSAFAAGAFANVDDYARHVHSLAVFVAPDPNIMLRAARYREFRWQRPVGQRRPGEHPRFMSLSDAIQIASALWVKEVVNVPNLEFLAIDADSKDDEAGRTLSLLRLQDYADDAPPDSDVMAAVRLVRTEPVFRSGHVRPPVPVA